ncbi:MAG: glycosyltransferase family 4 protein [Chitinophagaceae bacterium]|nr:glycosyltransferase family 4 protein [Chitinophagaceae bacterium]
MTYSKTNKPIRVVMILASMPPMPVGGAEVQAVRLCRYLNKIGVQTEIITWGKIWHRRRGEFKDVSFRRLSSVLDLAMDLLSLLKPPPKPGKVKIAYDSNDSGTAEISRKVWLGMRARYSFFYINALVYLWFRRKKFDIIHAHMMEWPAFVAVKIGRKLKKPVVVKDSTMNGIFSMLRYPNGQQKQQQIATYAWCVAMTKMIKENLEKAAVPTRKIIEIPNGIDITPLPSKTSTWSNRVVFVGNLTQQPAKGIDILLFAWKQVVQKHPSAWLEIIGSGDLDAYRKFTGDNHIINVIFAGKQENVRERILESDIFVLPSRREGMSNALMEAMLCGMPIVATDVSGNQDLITDGVSGLLVQPADIQGLATAIIRIMDDTEKSIAMGRKAYESIKSKCDMRLVAEKYKNLYQKIQGEI